MIGAPGSLLWLARFELKLMRRDLSRIRPIVGWLLLFVFVGMHAVAWMILRPVVKLDLPRATANAELQKPEKIEFAIDAQGGLFWNGERLTREDAIARFTEAGQKRPQPEVYLRADQTVPYRYVAQTLADASKGGLSKVAFVSEPER